MIPHLQIEKKLELGEFIDLTPWLYQRRMLFWHRFEPESSVMRKITDALVDITGDECLPPGLESVATLWAKRVTTSRFRLVCMA